MYSFASRSYKVSAADISARVFLNDSFLLSVGSSASEEELLLHFHTQYELFFARDLPLVMQIEGEEYTFTDTAVYIAPFVRHYVKKKENAFGFRFDLKQPHSLFASPMRALAVGEFSYRALERLAEVYGESSPAAEESASALLKLVFLDLYESNVHSVSRRESNTVDDYCMIIDDFVHRRYEEPVTLKEVAAALHLSTKQTSRIIRNRYHTTLSAMLNEKRLAVAAFLLKHSEQSVTEIAERLFHRSDNYFFRLFRERYGTSPLQYRKQRLRNEQLNRKPKGDHV